MLFETYVQIIKDGGLVAFPTETVYGLGADAWNTDAIHKIFRVKGRPSDNPLIVHISDKEMIHSFTDSVSKKAELLMDQFWPGPLTLIFKKRPEVLDRITAGLDSVAIRMPNHEMALKFIEQTGPLVAPSANLSGRPSPTKPEHVKSDFGDTIPILNGGSCEIGIESTVLDVRGEVFEIYRPGYVTPSEIGKIAGCRVRLHEMGKHSKPISPGMKYSHYSPAATVLWMDKNESLSDTGTLYLIHSDNTGISPAKNIVTYQGDYRLFIHEIYDRFRQADREQYRRIAIEPFEASPSDELKYALLNRIRKAIGYRTA